MEHNFNIIEFTSRYNDTYTLTLVDNNTYRASIGNYYRVGGNQINEGIYEFIDPSGGPFIEVGRVFPYNGKIVKSIKDGGDEGVLIEFEG